MRCRKGSNADAPCWGFGIWHALPGLTAVLPGVGSALMLWNVNSAWRNDDVSSDGLAVDAGIRLTATRPRREAKPVVKAASPGSDCRRRRERAILGYQARLIAEYGPLPPTPTVRTGRGGFHYWFRFPPGTGCGKPYPGIDRKAIGGYVIVPPSRIDIPEHEGRAYAWEDGCKPWEGVPYAEAPAWSVGVAPLAAPHGGNGAADADDPWIVRASNPDLLTHPGSSHGERRETFCQLAGIHLARGDSEASVRAMAEAWAMRCTPTFDGKPNPDDHWEKHLAGLLAKEAAKAMKMTTPHAPLPYTVSVSIAEDRSDTILSPVGRKE